MTNREIDALIAEKVMGWLWFQSNGDNNLLSPDRAAAAIAIGMWRGRNPERKTTPSPSLPNFSTDPTASKQLRDKMRAAGWRRTTTNRPGEDSLSRYWKYNGQRVTAEGIAFGKTDEESDALAALRAVGVEVEERNA